MIYNNISGKQKTKDFMWVLYGVIFVIVLGVGMTMWTVIRNIDSVICTT